MTWIHNFMLKMYSKISPTPFVSVCGVIKKGNRLLILNSADGKGHGFPGGIIHYGERVEDALKREILEETGFKVDVRKLIGVYSEEKRDPRIHSVLIAYSCEITSGKPSNSKEGIAEFISIDKLPKLSLGHDKILEDFSNC